MIFSLAVILVKKRVDFLSQILAKGLKLDRIMVKGKRIILKNYQKSVTNSKYNVNIIDCSINVLYYNGW